LFRGELGLVPVTKENMLIGENRVEVGNGGGPADADLADFLPVADDAGEKCHRLGEITVHLAGVLGEGGSNDRGTACDVTDEPTEVRTGFEECPRDVDDSVELVERRKINLRDCLERGDQLGASAGERLRQQVLLVLEEQIDRRRGEAGEKGDLSQRPVPHSMLAEHPLSGVEDLCPILRPTSGPSLGAEIELRLRSGRSLAD